MTRPRQSALDVFISELEEFDGVNETLAGRKRLLRVLKQARKDAEDRKRLDWFSRKMEIPGDKDFNGIWRTPYVAYEGGRIACFGVYRNTVRKAMDAAMEQK